MRVGGGSGASRVDRRCVAAEQAVELRVHTCYSCDNS